jgi:hypothetical protein
MRSSGLIALAIAIALGLHQGRAGLKAPTPVREIKVEGLDRKAFKAGDLRKPVVIATVDEVGKHFDKESAAAVKKLVRFDKEKLLVFSWQGSSGDRLSPQVAKGQVVFNFKAGVTDDVFHHVILFVIARDAAWKVAP